MSRSLLAATLALMLPTLAGAETLTLYTSQPNKDAQQTVDAFEAAHPEIKIEWVRDGTTKLMARVAAEMEAGQPQADVLLISDMVTLEGLAQQGKLAAYSSPEHTAYDASLYSAGGFYHSTKLITTGIVYNTGANSIPASWADLAAPEMANLVAMPSPLYSGAALIHLATVTGTKGLGWDYYEALAANNTRAEGGNGGTFKAVAAGEKPYGVLVDFLAVRAKANGSPVEFVIPKEGVSYVTEPVAIMAGSKHIDAASKFVDFLLSDAGQNLVVEMGYIPARNGVDSPEGFPARGDINLMAFDPAQALADADGNKERFAKVFGIQ